MRTKNRNFMMRLSDEERGRIDFLAEHYGVKATEAVRMLLKREETRIRDEEAERAKKGRRR